jgi:hypothetical protein
VKFLIGRQLMRWMLPALLIGYATVHRLGQTYGSTSLERKTSMPGDGIVANRNSRSPTGSPLMLPLQSCGRGSSRWAGIAGVGTPLVGSTSCCFRQISRAGSDHRGVSRSSRGLRPGWGTGNRVRLRRRAACRAATPRFALNLASATGMASKWTGVGQLDMGLQHRAARLRR